jgi:hypothetical protein
LSGSVVKLCVETVENLKLENSNKSHLNTDTMSVSTQYYIYIITLYCFDIIITCIIISNNNSIGTVLGTVYDYDQNL